MHSQRLLQHMDSSMKSDWCPAPARMTPHPFLLCSALSDARFPPRLFLLVQKLAHLLIKRQTNREDGWEEHRMFHQRISTANSSSGPTSPARMCLERGSAEK